MHSAFLCFSLFSAAIPFALGGRCGGTVLRNGGYEFPVLPVNTSRGQWVEEPHLRGWRTSSANRAIRVWRNDRTLVPSFEGSQHIDLLGQRGEVHQIVQPNSDGEVFWSFAHHGSSVAQTVEFRVVRSDKVILLDERYTTGDEWIVYAGKLNIANAALPLTLSFKSVHSGLGDRVTGNYIDDVHFGVPACLAIEPRVPHESLPVSVGKSVRIEIPVANHGAYPATDITLEVHMSKGLKVISGSMDVTELTLEGTRRTQFTDIGGDDAGTAIKSDFVQFELVKAHMHEAKGEGYVYSFQVAPQVSGPQLVTVHASYSNGVGRRVSESFRLGLEAQAVV